MKGSWLSCLRLTKAGSQSREPNRFVNLVRSTTDLINFELVC